MPLLNPRPAQPVVASLRRPMPKVFGCFVLSIVVSVLLCSVQIGTGALGRQMKDIGSDAPKPHDQFKAIIGDATATINDSSVDDDDDAKKSPKKEEVDGSNTTPVIVEHPPHVDPFYHDFPPSSAEPGSMWLNDEFDGKIPSWLSYYLTWHQHHIKRLWNPDGLHNDTGDFPDLHVQACTLIRCGGTSDRLKSLPAMLRLAYENKRILLYYWGERPYPLESFVEPPEGGLDWRVPRGGWIEKKIPELESYYVENGFKVVHRYSHLPRWKGRVVVARTNTGIALKPDYEKHTGDTDTMSFDDVYPFVWKLVFTPSPPVREKIVQKMKDLRLVPRQYVSVHVRARYYVDPTEAEAEALALNSLKCASELDPNLPVFYASDDIHVIEKAHLFASNRRNVTGNNLPLIVWNASAADPPLHLDLSSGYPVSDYYDTFVDLYLLAMGKCITHTVGGYGAWAKLIGDIAKCSFWQRTLKTESRNGYGKVLDPAHLCKWKDPSHNYYPANNGEGDAIMSTFFSDPMPERLSSKGMIDYTVH